MTETDKTKEAVEQAKGEERIRLDAAKASLGSLCEVHGWSVRLLPKVSGYSYQLVLRKPQRKQFGGKDKAIYRKALGSTELETYENLLAMIDSEGMPA